MKRNQTSTIQVGTLRIGGESPITVQSMCNTKTWDVEATVGQIRAVNMQKRVVTIGVELFGRDTPVDIGFAEIVRL